MQKNLTKVNIFPIPYILAWQKFMYRVHALSYAPAVILHSIRMMFTLIIFIDTSDSYHCRGSSMRFNENSNSDPILLDLVKFIL